MEQIDGLAFFSLSPSNTPNEGIYALTGYKKCEKFAGIKKYNLMGLTKIKRYYGKPCVFKDNSTNEYFIDCVQYFTTNLTMFRPLTASAAASANLPLFLEQQNNK